MVDDKYIGLGLAMSSALLIGTSLIITKKGLNDAGERNAYGASASDNLSYLRNPTWWAGISTLANFAAYTFAPPILVTPLGALSVIVGAILASFLLGEELGHLGRLGCTLCLLGSLIIVLHAPEDKPVETVDEILHYAIQPGFLMYSFTVLVFTLVMIYGIAPRYGRSTPVVYVSICSLVGSVSVMAIKGFGVAVKLTFSGKNQFTHPSTYVFGIIVALCILVQMTYFNKALDLFSTNVVNPMYYVGFSSATILASLILFQGFNTDDASNTLSLLTGFIVTFLGVHLLNLSRTSDTPHDATHSALEGGVLNPRLSLQGRVSLDGWGAPAETPRSATARTGHGRRSSLYRAQSTTLFNAFEEEEHAMGQISTGPNGTPKDDDDDDEGVDERTGLTHQTKKSQQPQHQQQPSQHQRQNGSRSHTHSPVPPSMNGDARTSQRPPS
ncbi:DUF803-domain-containing protein [Pluteus cervinus]|uniref:DUF803-domain-containing protein n=1 Tax=Pluteus cervinus TaxID=181527 RepID=A0ACD3AZL3_9AGAR|nr:DUF803-domain-containing protein [Pluteus cervinus]